MDDILAVSLYRPESDGDDDWTPPRTVCERCRLRAVIHALGLCWRCVAYIQATEAARTKNG